MQKNIKPAIANIVNSVMRTFVRMSCIQLPIPGKGLIESRILLVVDFTSEIISSMKSSVVISVLLSSLIVTLVKEEMLFWVVLFLLVYS